LYFVPDVPGADEALLRELGLDVLLEGGYAQCNVAEGPAPKTGVVLAAAPANPEGALATAGYYPDRQEWLQAPGKDYWIGFEKDNRPGPADLERKKLISGHPVKLSDGHTWAVPVARSVNGSSPLPRRLAWDGAGWIPGGLLEEFKELFAQACAMWDTLIGAEATDITLTDECNTAAMALGLNYRLSPIEISALGLFDTKTEVDVLMAVIDWPMVESELKKKRVAGADVSGPGKKD